jgi:hypothetical protein
MSVPRDAETFGNLLRTFRLTAGLIQEALAERSGVGTRTIQHSKRVACGRATQPHAI